MTITIQPAARVVPTCRTNPNLWLSTEYNDRALAVHICQRHCPFAAACETWPRAADAVQAGVLHDRRGLPVGRQPKPSAKRCVTCGGKPAPTIPPAPPAPAKQLADCGTYAAYRRHKRRDEQPCQPCTDAYRRQERERGTRRRQPATNPCGSIAGLTRHRQAGEPPCDVCVAAQREAAERGRQAMRRNADTQDVQVDLVRRLAESRLSDVQIGARLHMSSRQVRYMRNANGIPAGLSVAHRGEVAA